MTTVEATSSVRAEARYVRAAPRKAQLVVDEIRGRTVPEARAVLAFMTRDAANDVRKVLDSAVANAEANHGLAGDELVVTAAYVGAGPTLKRWRARARGRVGRIRKRTCHITVALALPSGEAIPEPIERPAPTPAPLPAEPVAEEEAVAEEAPAEEKPKRARAPRKKAEPAAEQAAEAEEKPKPKRTRAAKPKAEGEAEKPKTERKPRAKKTETEGSED
ncbi:MAG: 50S ribosomal protein L22 [Gaiellaceae bacterium]